MRRRRFVLLTTVAAFLAPGVAYAAPVTVSTATTTALTSSESSFLRAVNRARESRGLSRLRVDGALTRAARYQSRVLLARSVLDHGNFAWRMQRFDARGPVWGENLAWGSRARARPGAIVRAWLASPGHRANLLRPGYRRIGVGTAKGAFAGFDGAVVVTADFAGR